MAIKPMVRRVLLNRSTLSRRDRFQKIYFEFQSLKRYSLPLASSGIVQFTGPLEGLLGEWTIRNN